MGNFEESMAQCEKAAELTQRLGAKNFEPFQLLNFALLLAQDDPAKAIQLARKGVDICHETGPSFVGPWALGALAVVAENRRQSREALEAGEQLLGSDCVAHCHLWFYRHAMDAALKWEDWENAARFASKLEDYTAQEPLPCCDFFVLRTRSLVSNALKPDDPDTRSTISRLRRQAEQSGFTIAMQALTQVGLA
jgi:hypothetical protein